MKTLQECIECVEIAHGIEIVPKYKVKDKVVYLDIKGVQRVGVITNVLQTDVYDWSKRAKPLYIIDRCKPLRSENDILRRVT